MNILIVSNMYPSKEKPYSGLFVVNQVEAVKNKLEKDDILDFYYMKRTFTNKLGSILKYLKFFSKFIVLSLKKEYKYDIIHIHYYFPTIYIALIYKFFFNKNVKILVTFHGSDLYKSKKNFFFTMPFRYITKCIGVSSSLCQHILKYSKNKPINLSAGINPIFKKIENVTKYYDIIFIGSFYDYKGFDRLCNFLSSTELTLNVCIIGSGELEKLIYSILDTNKHNIDIFRNLEQDKIIYYLNISKILLNLSRKESFGLSMTEAMRCGLPVISTRTDGAFEQIIDGVNGILLKSLDDKEIILELNSTLNRLLKEQEEIEKLGMNALKNSEKYSLVHVAYKVINIYKSL